MKQTANSGPGNLGSVASSSLKSELIVATRPYASSAATVYLSVELRKFEDPLRARLAQFKLMIYRDVANDLFNPVKGYMLSREDVQEIYDWVDGVWLGTLIAYD